MAFNNKDEELPQYNDEGSIIIQDQIHNNQVDYNIKIKILAYGCLIVSSAIVNIIIWSIYFHNNS